MNRLRHLLVTATVLLSGATAARATTFTVADGDVAGLIAAIQQANSAPGLDTIILAANGNYTLTQVHNTIRGDGTNGLPIVVDDLTIVGNGAVILRSAAPAVPAFRFFYVSQKAELTLENLTLHNGRATSDELTSGATGGAILARGTLSLSGCFFTGNVALGKSSVSFGSGGAVYAFSALTVNASRFLDNSAFDAGGAIASSGPEGSASISDSTFEGNSARLGGALFRSGGTLTTITSSTFAANHADGGKGGAGAGGAVQIIGAMGATSVIANSTFSANTASGAFGGAGGGVFLNLGSHTIVHSTFIENAANEHGGNIYFAFATLHLSNSLLEFAVSGADCVNTNGSMPTNINNLIRDGSCNPMLTGNPHVAALGNYGGPTETHALLGNSPALDVAASLSCTSTDQRGVPRPVGPACDIGAFEGMLPQVAHRVDPMTRPPLFIPLCDPLRDATITVIVRGDRSLDARTVLVDSVAVGNARPGSVTRSRLQDVDEDGDVDVVLEFALTDVYRGLSCQSTTSLAVDGLLTNGDRFVGLVMATPSSH
jgi:hypothetical protein